MYIYRKYLENEESLIMFTLFDARALSVVSLENFIILKSTKLSESDFMSNFEHTVAMSGKPNFRVSLHVCNVLSNRFYFGSVYLAKNIFYFGKHWPGSRRAGRAGGDAPD